MLEHFQLNQASFRGDQSFPRQISTQTGAILGNNLAHQGSDLNWEGVLGSVAPWRIPTVPHCGIVFREAKSPKGYSCLGLGSLRLVPCLGASDFHLFRDSPVSPHPFKLQTPASVLL